jgi:hypothetical protein
LRRKAPWFRCAVRAHWCGEEGVQGAWGCARGTRGGRRVRSVLEWQGGGRVSVAKSRVGWPEEPQLRGVLMVRFRKSSNARRIAGMSQCVGCGVILRRTRRKMPPVRRGVTLRRKRVTRKMVAVRRGVTLRRRRVMRKVARVRKRVTRRWGMRCRKPCQRWGMKSLTRPPRPIFAQGLKRRNPLRHHPKCQCGLRMCLVYLYLFISCVQLRLSSEDFQW